MSAPIANALTIAGSDSGGGAGIQADLKSFSANGVYGASVITALTAQNTMGVDAVEDVTPAFVSAQLDAIFEDIRIDAVKIGMLASIPVIEAVADGLKRHAPAFVVLDPVMVTTTGVSLIADDAVAALAELLFPLASLITPNLHEAARLLETDIAASREEMEGQAHALLKMGPAAVLLKGGHVLAGEDARTSSDLLATAGGSRWFEAERIETENTHGTGCSLSSAIAANLAKGNRLEDAIEVAKRWLTGAIAAADELDVGRGSGPVHHFHAMWPISETRQH